MGYETEIWRKPALPEGLTEVFSEHGRALNNICYRSYWFTVTKGATASYTLRVKHGAGEESIDLSYRGKMLCPILEKMSSDERFFTLFCMFQMASDAESTAMNETAHKYRLAFIEGRLKKRRKNHRIYVDIIAPQPKETDTANAAVILG